TCFVPYFLFYCILDFPGDRARARVRVEKENLDGKLRNDGSRLCGTKAAGARDRIAPRKQSGGKVRELCHRERADVRLGQGADQRCVGKLGETYTTEEGYSDLIFEVFGEKGSHTRSERTD